MHADETLAHIYAEAVRGAPADELVRAVLLCHLAEPSTPATRLAEDLGVSLDTVRAGYRACQGSAAVARLVNSLYYPHRMRWSFATATVQEWQRVPERPERIRAHEPVLSETVEIHPTRGTCNYRCAMCLWSDQDQLTYATKQLDTSGLMTGDEWVRVLSELRANGVCRLAVSGGGEALINPDLPAILTSAADLGFEIHVYTTGFSIRPGGPLFDALLRCHRIRFSIHSPEPANYDRIAGTQPRQHALDRVVRNLGALLADRNVFPNVGIGFVIQPFNHSQIEAMVDFAADTGADWLDLRKDEVDVTAGLTADQLELVRSQLRAVRRRPRGIRIDLGDELVAIANGQIPDRSRTSECLGRYFRPTIGAYGHLTPCDLKAEPRFARTGHDLGSVKHSRILDVVAVSSVRRIPDDCAQCMPSSRTGNLIVHKLLDDLAAGIGLDDQPFLASQALCDRGSQD
ncbi:radical SAM protein [Nocardia sp. NBC_01730]|uniref:radical SAM protein n=1 Tax=Nocardia sp. NBC_01730 TaxID=2975998 RepID=UPI002E0F3307|nr:radical SAM protein [Nocardia sp. NBC_01730]